MISVKDLKRLRKKHCQRCHIKDCRGCLIGSNVERLNEIEKERKERENSKIKDSMDSIIKELKKECEEKGIELINAGIIQIKYNNRIIHYNTNSKGDV